MKREQMTYLLARVPLGFSFFGHGLIRLTKLDVFSDGIIRQFSKSMLPEALVSAFGHALPFAELIVGVLLILGLFTRFSILLGAIVILALIFGSSLIEQWNAIFTQLFYSVYLTALYYFSIYNRYSVDGWLKRSL